MNWLGGRDSNPDTMVQSHVSYRWTTSHQGGNIEYTGRTAPPATPRRPYCLSNQSAGRTFG